ncbi:hypothetical protein L7F22_068987 [Adiantum nelumboides]|nr:hypothetical protein [Adiantum nelumboides]
MGKQPFNRQFVLQVLKGRWMVVVVCLYILAFAGGPYVFGIYSQAIKAELQYDEETIDTLSFFKDLGNNVGIISGLLNEILPPWVVLGVGSSMNLFGFVMMWMAVTHRIAQPPLWQMYLYMTIGSNSMSFFNTGVVVTCVKNFPESRGEVLGLVKGVIGLSTAILTQIYHALYAQNAEGMLLLLGWLPSLVTFICMFVVRETKPVEDKKEGKHFFSFLYLALFLAAFLMFIIIVENQVHLTSISYKAIGAIILVLVALNVVVAIRAEREADASKVEEQEKELKDQGFKTSSKKQAVVHNEETSLHGIKSGKAGRESEEKAVAATPEESKSGGMSALSLTKDDHDGLQNDSRNISAYKLEDQAIKEDPKWIRKVKHFYRSWPQRGEDFSIPHAMLSLDMWIVFVVAVCGIGATLTVIDNVGQIGESLGYSAVSISTCVSLISIWNFLGRVGSGYISEMLLRRYRFPRTLILMVVVGMSCAGHLILAFPMRGALYIASTIEGLTFGAQWPVLFAVISELFGLKHYATLYNVAPLAAPLGSYLLKVRVAGYLYDKEAAVQAAEAGKVVLSKHWMVSGHVGGGSRHEVVCVGPSCFRLAFLIMTLVSALGTIIAGWLVLRTRKFYRQPSTTTSASADHQDKGKDLA